MTSVLPSFIRAFHSGRRGRIGTLLGHAAAGAVVTLGLAAELVRPLAPELGPAPDPGAVFDAAFLARAGSYRAPLRSAGLASLAVDVGVPLLVLATPVGRRALDRLGPFARRRPALGAVAVAVGITVAVEVAKLPLSYWAGYVHEGVWGFRTQDLGGWASDWVRYRAPAWAATAALAGGAVVLIRRLPRAWPPVAGLAAAGVTALLVFAAPLVLEPLAYRFSPLPDGPVRDEVVRVLESAGTRVDQLLVADASRRTTKQNAYVSGLGATRRVVLYDTLIEGRSPEEIGVVLAHELGHDRNADVWRGALLGAAGAVAGAYALAVVLAAARRRGLDATAPRTVAAVVAALTLLQVASLPAQSWLSRRAETAADFAALELTGQPEVFEAMQRGLAEANLGDPAPPRWSYALWSTHPSTVERIGMARGWADAR